jgi:hypothetical protein
MGSRRFNLPERRGLVDNASNDWSLCSNSENDMSKDYLPTQDAQLALWTAAFGAKIEEYGGAIGLTDPQILEYTGLQEAFATALARVQDGVTRSPSNIVLKDQARDALTAKTRTLVGFIQEYPGTTDAQRSALQITIRKTTRTPSDPIEVAPRVVIASVKGMTFTLNIADPTSVSKKKRYEGSIGAQTYSYVGDEYPQDPALWAFHGTASKYVHEITMPFPLVPGTQVWVTAAWVDIKGRSGPLADPVSARVEYAGAANAQQMKLAA